ncbi:N-(5'-phosphoribosyl)anthranilate isomerase [Candidatus Methylomirabilis lanthanidiphila]|uniref:N-(5'-phosphoribosyl)anthranilate isomerase n=1 Tax=Candidatus Methylomirabilis lanthanidiphila TaxID=2211376 RepID=A0A564ZGA5_9BACT|nr:phosphoribosylanthranilate isomerase [Candidatus Methylomirabilis lanthanidiphila]VUZ84360.1 N-(5'-phosphoribosyl)anthranilate isomerase [Candidatus Methylomirabilis lanthanidiphila]
MIRVKICGITSRDDAWAAVEAGADALGFIFVEGTPRYIEPEAAAAIIAQLPPFVTTVGVFIDRTPEEIERIVRVCGLSLIQLHGQESPDGCSRLHAPFIKAIRVQGERDLEAIDCYPQARAFLLDTYAADRPGGTGRTFPWEIAARAAQRATIILSGGLTPKNVALAVRQVRPYAIDVCSGVEAAPGRKDYHKVREFIEQARKADTH